MRTKVTGGGRGIGRAIALQLAQAGCDVALLARTREQVEAVTAEIRALFFSGQMTFGVY